MRQAITERELSPIQRRTVRTAPWKIRADAYDYCYTDAEATKQDVLAPGFFQPFHDELIVGTLIEVRLGDPQDGILRGFVQVITRTENAAEPIEVSCGEFKRYTPVRHSKAGDPDSELKSPGAETKPKGRAAA